jgi:ornithine cyclodeaminase/alanine dehydrogenase-like protein (mu-crystallin family)
MLFVSEKDTRELLNPKAAVAIIEQAACWDAAQRIAWCDPSECTLVINEPKSRYRMKSCALLDVPVAGLRMIGYPQSGNEPPESTRFLLLSDPATGRPLALIDDHWNYTVRTAVSAVVGLRSLLPNRASVTVAMIGAGNLAYAVLLMLREVCRLGEVRVISRRLESAKQFAEKSTRDFGVLVRSVESIAKAVDGVDLLVTATSANKKLIDADLIRPGMTICTLGRYELAPEIYKSADKVIFDKWEVAKDVPDVKELVAGKYISEAGLYAELNDLVLRRKPGRAADGETILFRTDGLVAQDVAIGWVVYTEALKQNRGIQI